MLRFGKAVVRLRYPILLLAVILLIPSFIGMQKTRINYDILTYLPSEIETMRGQDILEDEFGTGAITMLVVEDKDMKEVAALKEKIEGVDHVKKVLWYDSFADLTVPVELLPDRIRDVFMKEDSTLLAITYDSTTSSDETLKAVGDIRQICDKDCYLGGMPPIILDTKDLAEAEEPIYVLIAVALAFVVLMVTMDTFLAPVFFLTSIGMAILYNLGSNVVMGQISYITKALAAVLQLGVTMDYSIFLWHSYDENRDRFPEDKEKAMAHAISNTLQSVIGSSVTTIAGFIALCFMSLTLGFDIGLVMAKGVIIGVIGCVTILPSLILTFDRAITRTRHRPLLPSFKKLPGFVQKHYRLILLLFAVIWIPAIWGYTHYGVYYELDKSLPAYLPSVTANSKQQDAYDLGSTHMLLVSTSLSDAEVASMCEEMKEADGVKEVIGLDYLTGGFVPEEMLPEDILNELESDNYRLILVNSAYKTASDEVNDQLTVLDSILKTYDPKGMLIGDAPCTKDLITISAHDFNVVNWVSIGLIFAIILIVFKSLSLPVLLVAVIEFAIFINMGIPAYTGTTLPFIASIVIGTIQLGSTVDYAILMTSRYLKERERGADRSEAVRIAHSSSVTSIIVSALSFFAATFGVGLYSNISIISSLCILMARGALISMAVVLTVLPSVLLLFDGLIIRSTLGAKRNMKTHYRIGGESICH